MVYKSRRINKSKRQSSRKRRMYGGDPDEIINKIEEENKIELPNIEEIPVVGPVLEKTGSLVEGAAVKGLDVMGDAIGVDIDNPQSISNKLEDIKMAVSNPVNIEKTKEILKNSSKYVELGVDAAAPIIEKTADKIFPVVAKEADKAVKASARTLVNLAEDVVGPFVGIPRTLLSAAEAFNASVNAGSELVKGTAEAIQGTQENYKNLLNQSIPQMPQIPDVPKMPEVPQMQVGGAANELKKYKKEASMIGGRIRSSQLDFLAPHVKSSQIIQHSRKNKRRNLRHKMTSRRR